MKHLTLIVTLALIAVIGYAFYTAFDVFAAGSRVMDTRQAHCITALNIEASTHAPKGSNPHPMCVPANTGNSGKGEQKSKDNKPVAVSTPAAIVTTTSTPAPTVHNVPAPVVSDKGNPGNLKAVGHSGENPNGKDTMPLDSGSVDGNGEHGNQGQGGK